MKKGARERGLFVFPMPFLSITFGPEPRHAQIERLGVRPRIVMTDIAVRQVLVAIADADTLALLANELHTPAKVDGVHELRTLGRKHAVQKVDKAAIRR